MSSVATWLATSVPRPAAREPEQRRAVVVERAPCHCRAQIGGKRRHPLAGHGLDEMEGVAADVAERTGLAGACRIGPPSRLRAGARILGARQPALGV